jgi:tetratricopeptide (TPR) repeat protein
MIAKYLALLYGFEGDSERGLAYLRMAGEQGLYTRDASLIMLMNLYSEFETPDSSICNMAGELYKRYPDNPLVHWRYGDILFKHEDYEAARKIYQEVMDRISSDYRFYRNRMFSKYLISYRLGMCDKNLGRKQKAIQAFKAILANSEITPEWVVPATYMACGEIYLEENNAELARTNFEAVLKYDDFRGSRVKADSMLKELKK